MIVKHWLDNIIEKQKCNIDIMERIAAPLTPAGLQEMAEYEGFEDQLS